MASISKFDANVYSEELYQFNEAEYDEIMAASAVDDFEGYSEWSGQVDGDVENFYVKDGKVYHKPLPRNSGRAVVVL